VDETYTEKFYPIIWAYYSHPLTGFYGQGLAEDLLDYQIRQNELNDYARKSFDLFAVPRVLLPTGSKLGKAQLTNEIGQVIPVQGAMPTFFTPQALNAEFFKLHELNRQAAFAKAGIAQATAVPEAPPRIESGVGVRELSDNQRQRLSAQQSMYENKHLDASYLLLHLSWVKANGRKPTSSLKAKNLFDQIDWAAYKESAKNLRFNVQASSTLNDTPAARKDTAIEFAQYGVPLRPDELRKLINHPDLELSDKRATAALENIEWLIGELMKGEYHPPMPLQDLSLGIERVTAAFNTALTIRDDKKSSAAKGKALNAMSLWVTSAKDLMERMAQEEAAKQAAMMPQPMNANGVPSSEAALAAAGDNTVRDAALAGLFRQ
jgi:hypothetical protein